jgi:hypothetical protein
VGAPLSELYFIFRLFIFSHLHCCGKAKGTPPSAALECYVSSMKTHLHVTTVATIRQRTSLAFEGLDK